MASQMHDISPDAPISGSSWQRNGYFGLGDVSRKPNERCVKLAMEKMPSRESVDGPSPDDQYSHSCQASTVHIETSTKLEAARIIVSMA